MKLINVSFSIFLLAFVVSCRNNDKKSDAYGNFEATELMISSEMPGKIIYLNAEEGMTLKKGEIVGQIDTILLEKQKRVISATINSVNFKTQSQGPEIDILIEQKDYLLREKKRLINLLEGNAATQKQVDDIINQISVIDKKIDATKTKYSELNKGVLSQKMPLQEQYRQIQEQILKSKIVNPIDGQILTVYKRAGEVTGAGVPLYKIADLSYLNLKCYVSGMQLPHIKLNQKVQVLIDEDAKTNRSMDGEIVWISGKAEFTPKTVQTKEERVNQVYAVKVKVLNDGSLKIGLPGEVNFTNKSPEK